MVEWIPLPRDSSLCATELLPAAEHPLTAEHPAAAPPNQLAAAPRSPEPIPLADDPLTAALQAETETEAVLETGPAAKFSDAALSNAWRSRKQAILSKFTTTQKIAVQEVFGDREDPLVALGSSVEVGPRMMNSAAVLLKSQTEFQEMVRGYEQRLEKFWDQEDKVSALKVGIQCVKFIANSSVGWFYPFKYVLIKDVLDKLSERVYARLKGLGLKNPERDDFLSSEIAPAAKVVGNNWIYKVSCIRELLPRLYSELALIPCYRMMDHADIAQILVRIASTIRGIGDPIVSSFCRAYLASQVLKLRLVKYNMKMVYRDCLLVAMDDTMSILYLLLTSKAFSLSNMLVKVESNSELLEVISPAIAWIMYTFAEDASEDELLRVVDAYKKKSNHGFFLYHIVDSFPASFVSKHAILFCDLASCAVNDDFKPVSYFLSQNLYLYRLSTDI